MKEPKLKSILSDFKIDNSSFIARVILVKSELRGSAEFTNQVWEPGHVPVNKYFDRNPRQSYRFIKDDKVLLMTSIGCDTGRIIYYACEIIDEVPTNNWWYFQHENPFEDCETLMEAS
jgi:hypothetical protein